MRHYKCALVTGGTHGIGAAFARCLPQDTGLLLVARHDDELDAMKGELDAPGRTVETLNADLTRDDGRQAVQEAAERLEIDLLINNAGTGAFGRVLDNDPDHERKTVELNVVAVSVLTRGLLPGMIERARLERRRAGLILVSSTTAFQPVPMLATYAATKSFILAYGEALAEELRGQPVDVLVLCPGATRTGFGRQSGLQVGRLPGAEDPRSVARGALAALGRNTVHVRGVGQRAALAPFLMGRRFATSGLGMLMGIASRSGWLNDRQG
jgi:short-subunit dehydrogenase